MKTVPLSGRKANGRVALVDDGNYPLVSGYRWNVREHEHPRYGPYAIGRLKGTGRRGRLIFMHNLLMGFVEVDHADGNGLNNQRQNLRAATRSQNQANRAKAPGHTSRYKGVCWNAPTGSWRAKIQVDKQQRHLGLYDDEAGAARAYDTAALAAWGEFARLNFPIGSGA